MRLFLSDEYIEQGSFLSLFHSSGVKEEDLHGHDFIEIVYVNSGRAREWVDDTQYEVRAGDLLLLNYQCLHRFVSQDDFSFYNVCFHPAAVIQGKITQENAQAILLLAAFEEIQRKSEGALIHFHHQEREEIEAILQTMLTECQNKRSGWQTILQNYMSILFTRICRKLTEPSAQEKTENARWQAIRLYIDEHLCAPLTLSDLAEHSYYNPSYFSRTFREKFGVSFTEYLNLRRVNAAARLCADPTLSVEEIATRSGFASVAAMYRSFRRWKGITFAQYRQKK